MHVLYQDLPLPINQSGHYILPFTVSTQVLQSVNKQHPVPHDMITLPISSVAKNLSFMVQHAEKLHRQFAHVPVKKLLPLIKGTSSAWSDNLPPRLNRSRRLLQRALHVKCIRCLFSIPKLVCHLPLVFRRQLIWT